MLLLFDESMPRPVRRFFPDMAEIYTAQMMGWSGKKNGELMDLAAKHGFEAMISADQTIAKDSRSFEPAIPILVLDGVRNHKADIKAVVPTLVEMLEMELGNGYHFLSDYLKA